MASISENSTCPAAKFAEFPSFAMYDEIITLRIGQVLKEFALHKGLLCHHSLYFKTLSNGRWPQSDKAVLDLPDDDLEACESCLSWLYTRRLGFEVQATGDSLEARVIATREKFWRLCKVYVLGDMRGIPALQNTADEAFIETWVHSGCRMFPGNEVTSWLYDNTGKDCGMRKLITHTYARSIGPTSVISWEKGIENWRKGMFNNDAWADLTIELIKLRGW
ncbi:hypothetical protein EJ08DRAFT_616112 [Tothia fuscella]|uniref:BTB domain-containing protein n=1 Tax=Tothia fuscella TaxID=1048955 RepID=A0A9P4NLH4_9PEZI|nr:hypothetical protein EJ08DRAFT_616112 [Tothia fuscella]